MKKRIALSTIAGLLLPLIVLAKPTIGPVTPVTATAGIPVNLQATVSSSVTIQRCTLWVDLAEIGEMAVSGGIASRAYTFPSGGSRIAFVFCRDTSGDMNSGPTTGIQVSGAVQISPPLATPTPTPTVPTQTPTTITTSTTPTPISILLPTSTTPVLETTAVSPDIGKLLKSICPQNADANHPCRAIYYIGKDAKRHAFPNSKIFFTWYGGFESTQEVEQTYLNQFPLGANVKYRAGVKMVKFTTDPKVYAVARGGVLRWVKTEELARALYGPEWNKQVDDISDAFYTDYTFGEEIDSVSDFSPMQEFNHSKE